MRSRFRFDPRLFFAAIGLAIVSLFAFATPAAAACIGGQPFLGANPSAAQKISDSAYEAGATKSIPEWYGYGAPPITAWYVQQGDGVINPSSSLCSTNDFGGLWNQVIPQYFTTLTAGLFEIDAALLDASTFGQEWMDNTQATIESIINDGPYRNLYQVLLLTVMPLAIITVMLLQFTQESRARGYFARAMISGGSLQSRRSAAIKEVGVIVGAVALFGAITSGGLYAVQTFVTDATNSFSNAVTAEFANFATDVSRKTASSVSPDICSATVSSNPNFAISIAESNALIRCNLYRIYQWTPWLVMQFGSTDVNEFAIDPSNIYEDREQLKTAMSQVEAKFGPEASVLAPYLQMQILRGNNNEAFNGPEMSTEDRIQAFDGLGNTIDITPSTQSWAQTWAGQGGALFSRNIDGAMALAFAVFAFVPVTLVLLLKFLAVIGGVLLPILGIFVSVLLVVRPWRQKALKIVKWWVYCLVLPPIITFALSLSLTLAMIVTNLVTFSGMGLFLYLTLSSIAFVGTLIYLIYLLRAKKIAGQIDGTADDPGIIARTAGAAAPLVGTAIAPGIGTAIGSAVGTQMAGGGDEPRPSPAGALDGEPRPALEGPRQSGPWDNGGIGAMRPEPIPAGPSGGGAYSYAEYDDAEIIDAEIIDETPEPAGRRGAYGVSGSAEPRALPAAPDDDSLNSNLPPEMGQVASTADIRAAVDEGVQRIQETTQSSAERLTRGTINSANMLGAVATEGAQKIGTSAQEHGDNLRGEATRASSELASATASAADNASTAVRGAADEAAASVSQAASGEREGFKAAAEEARVGVSEAAETSSARLVAAGERGANDIEGAGIQAQENVTDSAQDGVRDVISAGEQSAHEGEERIEERTEEANTRIIRRTRRGEE
jgi:hypothetical protein